MVNKPAHTESLRSELERLRGSPHGADVHMVSFPITDFPEYGIGLELFCQDCPIQEFPQFNAMAREVWSDIVRATALPPAVFLPPACDPNLSDVNYSQHTAAMTESPNQIFVCAGVTGAILRVLHTNKNVNREYMDTCVTVDKNETRMQNVACWAGSDLTLFATEEDVKNGRITYLDAPQIVGDGLYLYENCSERAYPERHALGRATHVVATRHLSQYHTHHGYTTGDVPFGKRKELIKKLAHELRDLWVRLILPQILADSRIP
jgi:hypothetical protein